MRPRHLKASRPTLASPPGSPPSMLWNMDAPLGLLALAAGFASFVSPCFLPIVPVFVGQMIGGAPGTVPRRTAVANALAFVAGFSVVFIALWASVGLIGNVVGQYANVFRTIGGIVLVVMGLHVADLVNIPLFDRFFRGNVTRAAASRTGSARAAVMGIVFAAGWTPCIGPILGAVLALASQSSTVWTGAAMMAFYCIGLGAPILAVAVGAADAHERFDWFKRHHAAISVASGAMLIAIGLLMVANLFSRVANLIPAII